jgi:transitional endoplasmic reticulum ATPase
MLCTNKTKEECLQRNLFGDREWRLPHLKPIKKGDIGFLLNVSEDELSGIFQAQGPVELNIEKDAWGGSFPAQVKVKLIGKLQTISNASDKLKHIVPFREIQKDPYPYKVPSQNCWGADVTNKVLSLFKEIPESLGTQIEETGRIPEITLENVAGLDKIKEFISKRVIAPFEDEEWAYKLRLRVGGGILLFGPPGTGKTLIGESIAKEMNAKFIEITPSVIVGYPGEAEKRIEKIFAELEKEPRAVLFLDEAEWILCKREEQTSSVMQRVTPVLLAQISRIFKEKRKQIIIIAATNKPEMIDSAFLRPGRFDKIFYVPLPDENARIQIVKLNLKERSHSLTEEDIKKISGMLEGYSGADIVHILEESAFKAFERRSNITRKDIEEIIKATPKSVDPEEIRKMEEWSKKRGLNI